MIDSRQPRRNGVIAQDEIYTLDEVQWRLNLEAAALRAARRNGLRCYRKHGRAFYAGADIIAYLKSDDARDRQGG